MGDEINIQLGCSIRRLWEMRIILGGRRRVKGQRGPLDSQVLPYRGM